MDNVCLGPLFLIIGSTILYFRLSKKSNLWNRYKKGDGMYDFMTSYRLLIWGILGILLGIIKILQDLKVF